MRADVPSAAVPRVHQQLGRRQRNGCDRAPRPPDLQPGQPAQTHHGGRVHQRKDHLVCTDVHCARPRRPHLRYLLVELRVQPALQENLPFLLGSGLRFPIGQSSAALRSKPS